MKIAPLKKAAKAKKPRNGTLFTELRTEFENSEPVNLREIGIVAAKAHRPQFSAFCKDKGLEYASIAINEEEAVYFLIAQE